MSLTFSKKAEHLFRKFKATNSQGSLAEVLSEIQDPLWQRAERRFRGMHWSNAQTFGDAFQILQQKAFTGAWDAREFDGLANLAAKAHVVICNHMLDRARRQQKLPTVDAALEALASTRRMSLDTAESKETAAIVRLAMEGLAEDWREALRMRYFDGYSHEDIADILGKPSPDAVRALLSRAREALARKLGVNQDICSAP